MSLSIVSRNEERADYLRGEYLGCEGPCVKERSSYGGPVGRMAAAASASLLRKISIRMSV